MGVSPVDSLYTLLFTLPQHSMQFVFINITHQKLHEFRVTLGRKKHTRYVFHRTCRIADINGILVIYNYMLSNFINLISYFIFTETCAPD